MMGLRMLAPPQEIIKSSLHLLCFAFSCSCHAFFFPSSACLQDVVAGDGTTSVVVICGALLKKCQELLERGIHPTVISDSFNKAANKACEVRR
jgi:hypothetical protein